MKSIFIYCIITLYALKGFSQHGLRAVIKDATSTPLQGAVINIKELHRSAVADSAGFALIKDIPAGKFLARFSHVGFEEKVIELDFPIAGDSTILVELEATEHEEDEVVVMSTRSRR